MDSIFLVVGGYFCFFFSKVAKVVRKKKHNLIAGTLLIKESGVLAEMINDQLELWSVFWDLRIGGKKVALCCCC